MMNSTWRQSVFLPIALLIVGLMAGCSGGGHAPQTGDAGPLTELSSVYLKATHALNRPPKSIDELKPYVAQGKDINSLLTSPNDKQPYVIIWGTDPRGGMDLKPLVVGYEKDGQGGVRFVFTAMGVMLMGAEEFKEANFPAGHTPGQ